MKQMNLTDYTGGGITIQETIQGDLKHNGWLTSLAEYGLRGVGGGKSVIILGNNLIGGKLGILIMEYYGMN